MDTPPSIYESGRYEFTQESEQTPLEFADQCRRRFREIYADDAITPDHLLKVLINGKHRRQAPRSLARESSEALGIYNRRA